MYVLKINPPPSPRIPNFLLGDGSVAREEDRIFPVLEARNDRWPKNLLYLPGEIGIGKLKSTIHLLKSHISLSMHKKLVAQH